MTDGLVAHVLLLASVGPGALKLLDDTLLSCVLIDSICMSGSLCLGTPPCSGFRIKNQSPP